MDEQVKKFLLQIIRRSLQVWWLYLAMAIIVGTLLFSVSFFLQEKYSSSEIISLKDEETFNTLLKDIVAPVGSQATLKSAESYLLTTPVLKRIALQSQLITEKSNQGAIQSAMQQIRKGLSVEENSNNSRIITITYTANSAEKAQRMAHILSKELVTQVMEARNKTAELALQFIESQRAEVDSVLSVAKAELYNYKKEHLFSLPDGFLEGTRDIFKLKKALVDDEAELKEIAMRLSLLQKSLREYSPLKKGILRELTLLEQEILLLKRKYTEKHPELRRLMKKRERLELKQKLLESEESTFVSSQGVQLSLTSDMKPALTLQAGEQDLFTMSRQMQEQELLSQKERLEARVKEYRSILDKLEISVQNIPEIEKGITSREEAVAELQKKQKQLLARYNSARHSIDVSIMNTNAGYSVLTEANLPQWPSFPIKENFFFVGFFIGGVLVLGIIILSELLFGRIYDVNDITTILKCRTLGTLPDLQRGM